MFGFTQAKREERNAEIRRGIEQKPFNFQKITIALDAVQDFPGGVPTANGVKLKISFPFRSVSVVTASSNNANIDLLPTDDSIQNAQSALTLKKAGKYDCGSIISGGYLSWNYQAGESIVLLFVLEGEYSSGEIRSITGSSSSVSEGTAVVSTVITAIAGSGVLLAADALRITTTGYVVSGTFYIGQTGTLGVPPLAGIPFVAGQYFKISNQGAWEYYSAAGGVINLNTES